MTRAEALSYAIGHLEFWLETISWDARHASEEEENELKVEAENLERAIKVLQNMHDRVSMR